MLTLIHNQAPAVRKIVLKETAKLVRKALKAQWPTVKFTVRCARYSMGQSIDVAWTDGPTSAEVDPVLKRFNGEHFDGMTDMASSITQEYEGETVQFEADFVTGQRSISPAFLRTIAQKVAAQYGVETPAVYDTEHDTGYVVSSVLVPDAPPFGKEEFLKDVIYYVARHTSALPKPRIRRMAIARQVA